jgi:F-type H+-transporting ATPase subunit epsilon
MAATETFHFSLVSPERELFTGDVNQVDAPGVEGEFGVLAHHAPFMTTLKPGIVKIYEGAEITPVFVRGGFADVTPAGLTILAEEAVRLTDVDVASLDQRIADARSDANDPGDAGRRARGAAQLESLEALKAAVAK